MGIRVELRMRSNLSTQIIHGSRKERLGCLPVCEQVVGIRVGAYVQANLSTYKLYTEVEKNARMHSYASGYADGNKSGYAAGFTEGNATGIAHVNANLSAYNLFSQKQKEDAETVSKSAGQAESLATVQADLASEGLSLITYLDEANLSEPYTNQWFYQPGMGWLWTNSKAFPFLYRASNQGSNEGGWLYFSQCQIREDPHLRLQWKHGST